MVKGTGTATSMATATDTGMVMGTGTIRMTRRWRAGRRSGRSYSRRLKEGGKSGTRDAGRGTENRDAGRGTNKFMIYDIRFTIEGLQGGLTLNHLIT